ncbi:pyridine nucleotide-disulfide oxidoreductase domain-containing protein 2 isoform X3 [Phodopus roborovskii]|uniref:pyridine nucleotide-disulfide oxidoreductase domain-containing protein 2 isoform X3 n=1 Tax=Phodopus roborovskii TaxID=109678 RepID=UPI0021E4E83D|nr:pyridine nucleotide-disulfide oxidoreductase domain-containing protein 2 isoform X3 [Phodopus roborovskii]
MAASRRGLSRALHSSPCPAWKRAQPGAKRRLKPEYDAVVIGAGHNGLVAAAYLQRLGVNTAVFERRHVIGGAAVTEEIIPGFRFSRASYLLSLLRPQIFTDLELKKHGLRLHPRNPYSFTPMLEEGTLSKAPRSLLLGTDMAENQKQISQFSQKDAQAFPRYEEFMRRLVLAIDPLLDAAPLDLAAFQHGSLLQRLRALSTLRPLLKAGRTLGAQLPQYYQVLTGPISKVLDHWFESEPLKATLATDAVIGAMTSPHTPGSGYVLLHHVMGSLEGMQGAWSYVQGGMGALSDAIASSATAHGASIFTEKTVAKVQVNGEGHVEGIILQDGQEVRSRVVLSCASPQVTFLELTPQEWLPEAFVKRISQLDTQSPVTKINVFDCIEAYAPGFKSSVLARDILTPPDLERIFGLPGGNIFHGAMSLDQLYFARPVPQYSGYRCPIQGLYLCGSGAHPGGGVMGASGRNAAHAVFRDLKSM